MIHPNPPNPQGQDKPLKPILPNWIMDRSAPETRGFMTLEAAGFASGSALALLHVVLHDPNINAPAELLRSRIALRAAINCCKIEGRVVTEAELRDAYLLTPSGDTPTVLRGPDGDMLALWRAGSSLTHSGVAGSAISFRHTGWRERLTDLLPVDMQEHFPNWMEQAEDGQGTPVTKAALLLGNIIEKFPRQEAVALLCADVILARALGWDRPLPLLGHQLKGKVLRAASDGADIRIAYHEAVARGAQDAVRLSHDLARRAARLRAVAPKLRSKGSNAAVELFLSQDAILPSTMLSPKIKGTAVPMTPRSARRLCDRLVQLGVVRELTGRKTFRLYGLA